MKRQSLVIAIALLAVALTQTAPVALAQAQRSPDVIFVPTPQSVVDAMLKLAKVGKDDVVYDLGVGTAASWSPPPSNSARGV